jgi:hypothetical protein
MTFSKTQYTSQYMQNWGFDDTFKVPTVEGLGYDGQNLQRINATNMSIRTERDGAGNPIYLGLAAPGTTVATAKWQIRKLTFDGSNHITAMEYANGSPNFNSVWNDRATLNYS